MSISYRCNTCGETHEGLPFTWGPAVPDRYYAIPAAEREQRVELSSDQCIIDGTEFFVLGRLEISVLDSENNFYWLAWVSLTEDDFARVYELWHTSGRESEPPFSGFLNSELPCYSESTLTLAAQLVTQPVGERPLIELERSYHPLAVEQRSGITIARVQEIAEKCIHGA
jgi:hypothetical protein